MLQRRSPAAPLVPCTASCEELANAAFGPDCSGRRRPSSLSSIAVSAAPKSGLGRGLAAILPTAESSEKELLTDDERILHSLANAGLDQLASTTKLDLLAYLHMPRFDEPVLFLRKPELSTLSPTRVYRLFARFVQAARSGTLEGTFTQDATVTVFLRTPGTTSDGVHFIGRTNSVIDPSSLPSLRESPYSAARADRAKRQDLSGQRHDIERPTRIGHGTAHVQIDFHPWLPQGNFVAFFLRDGRSFQRSHGAELRAANRKRGQPIDIAWRIARLPFFQRRRGVRFSQAALRRSPK